jgi:hypothetical protein
MMSHEGVDREMCTQLRELLRGAEVDGMLRLFEIAARSALMEPRTGDYCIYRIDEFGNKHDMINWSAVRRIYGCAIYVSPPDYSYRLIVMPGAVIAYTTDGARSYCAVHGEESLPTLLNHPFSEVHVCKWPPDDVETARAVCLR